MHLSQISLLWCLVTLLLSVKGISMQQNFVFANEKQFDRQAENIVLIKFRQPDTDESSDPRDRPRGGGSRRICKARPDNSQVLCTDQQLMALVPSNPLSENDDSSSWGLTLEEKPTLWFYIPYSSKSIHQVFFELFDSDGNKIFLEDTLKFNGIPGIIGYRPELSKNLEINKTYRWHLLLRLDPKNPSGDAYISGRIKRIAIPENLQNHDHTHNPRKLASVLAKAGIWYDTLTILAELSREDPQYWHSLLQSVGLKNLVGEPISTCCTSEQ